MGSGQYWPQAPEATQDLRIGKEELGTGGRGSLAGSVLTRLDCPHLVWNTVRVVVETGGVGVGGQQKLK